MKIALLNHSDERGGAAVASLRLTRALSEAGHDASLLTVERTSESPLVELLGTEGQRRRAFLWEHGKIFVRQGLRRHNLFKISTGSDGLSVWRHPVIQEADAIILNWTNQGMLTLKETARLASLGKKVFWNMHDMWPMTALCHHAGQCPGYKQACGSCPLLTWPRQNDLSRKVMRQKARLLGRAPIHYVAVSQWLADRARESTLLESHPISVIPNLFFMDDYPSQWDKSGPLTIVMGAARLDDPIKDLPLAIDLLNHTERRYPGRARALFFGGLHDDEAFNDLKMPFEYVGPVDDPAPLYARSHVVMSTSFYESCPLTLSEGMACGCIPFARDSGGQTDAMCGEGVTVRGELISAWRDAMDLVLRIAETDAEAPSRMRRTIEARRSAPVIAEQWTRLLNA